MIKKVWNYVIRHPTEVIFGSILFWFLGKRIVTFLINQVMVNDQEKVVA